MRWEWLLTEWARGGVNGKQNNKLLYKLQSKTWNSSLHLILKQRVFSICMGYIRYSVSSEMHHYKTFIAIASLCAVEKATKMQRSGRVKVRVLGKLDTSLLFCNLIPPSVEIICQDRVLVPHNNSPGSNLYGY